MTSLDMALTFVRGLGRLSASAPRLTPILSFPDLLEIETALPEIKTALLKIEIALPEIEILSYGVENSYQPNDGLVEV